MGIFVLVQLGIFLALLFGGIGLLMAGMGIMKWGNGQEEKAKSANAEKSGQTTG